MLIILQQLFILYIFLFLGWLFGKLRGDMAERTGILSFLLVNLFLPSKVFGTFSANFTVDYLKNNYLMIFVSVALLILLALVSIPVSKLITKNGYEQKVYRYSLTISNYAYMGYVLTEELFGAAGLTNLILFCIPFALYTYTFGYAMLTGKGKVAKKLINPITAAILLGIVFGLTGINIPAVLGKALSSASACVGPVSMILTGLTLSLFSFKELLLDKNAYIVVALRLIVLPLSVFGLCRLLGLTGMLPASLLTSATIMACMPTGLNTIVFPRLVGEDCKTGARLAFISHLLSLLTLPVWLSILL